MREKFYTWRKSQTKNTKTGWNDSLCFCSAVYISEAAFDPYPGFYLLQGIICVSLILSYSMVLRLRNYWAFLLVSTTKMASNHWPIQTVQKQSFGRHAVLAQRTTNLSELPMKSDYYRSKGALTSENTIRTSMVIEDAN